MNDIFPAAQTLISQIDKRWPNRIKEKDYFENLCIYIDPLLDGKKNSDSSAKELVDELVQLAKEGLDGQRIISISYKNKVASNHSINKFWIWQKESFVQESILIVFNDELKDKKDKFLISLFKEKTKKRGAYPKYPGVSSIKFKRKNKSVLILQKKLIEKGFTISEKEIGYYGLETCEAVKKFYRSLGIYSGTIAKEGKKIGPKGWKRLFE
jgi:hypothetical protein